MLLQHSSPGISFHLPGAAEMERFCDESSPWWGLSQDRVYTGPSQLLGAIGGLDA